MYFDNALNVSCSMDYGHESINTFYHVSYEFKLTPDRQPQLTDDQYCLTSCLSPSDNILQFVRGDTIYVGSQWVLHRYLYNQ